ncbi:uncharacterized protein LOC121728938 [Aricia agestis]|uniref:uncharacterized protein LOC121728938 n=1 Tax=Aricia agestis TaxID=91739 RepID=UPI001C204C57|nr:uncharacterized protein LOC121728938 [Aricia agestis]
MAQKPRKLAHIKPSKYEGSSVLHSNKEYWSKVFEQIDKNTENPIPKVLPSELSERVCEILGIGIKAEKSSKINKSHIQPQRRIIKEPYLSFRKQLHLDREWQSDTEVELASDDEEDKKEDVHREFLKKPIREQITWATHYLEPEKEHEKSLIRRADDLTDRIAKEFSDYMKQLGGDQQSHLFDTKTIKELFQIEFDTHVSRGLQVVPKELPTVEEKVAVATGNVQKSRSAALQREISKDIRAEKRPDLFLAFGRSVPQQDQWRNPRNDTRSLWRSARHVPRDLVTLKTVWDGITHLRSVKEYCRWMIEHPEHKRPPYLTSLGMFDPAVLDARLTLEMDHQVPRLTLTEAPAPVDHIRRRLSELLE